MPQEQIHHVRSIHRLSHRDFVAGILAQRRLPADTIPTETVEDVALVARIDHGRWLVDCPSCPGAELADLEDPRFFCLSCYSQEHDGRWLRVVFPEANERQAIEAALLERPEHHRHWQRGTTVGDLQIANIVERPA